MYSFITASEFELPCWDPKQNKHIQTPKQKNWYSIAKVEFLNQTNACQHLIQLETQNQGYSLPLKFYFYWWMLNPQSTWSKEVALGWCIPKGAEPKCDLFVAISITHEFLIIEWFSSLEYI